jgi:energy-converting hydrogenase A subunit M
MRQSPQGISYDIFGKCFELECTSVDMIHTPHVHSSISITAKLGCIDNQFYKFLRLCVSKDFLVSQMVSLIVFLKNKGYLLNFCLRGIESWSIKKKSFLEF